MRVADLLRTKGSEVATVPPKVSVTGLLEDLARYNVGALVVVDSSGALVGIVSERDVVRQLNERGAELLTRPVEEIMTTDVVTCGPTDAVDSLAEVMTQRRVRHMPVVDGGRLVGLVSIGDVVKSRIEQLESDREQLESYIAQG
ncbi:CBS domain-containing protein [Actinophytocola sp.]|uniref:CBS domain-containing protein n=1 Tax=Actinophytocola sp. TaxID=1872138 RepID=UPI002ED66968